LSTEGPKRRIEAVDVVRGVIMIVMALDHVRDFFGVPGISPTDPARAGAALFFTRWVTNICAPVFFLLTGTGAYLSLRSKSVGALSWFLFTRGLWLILLELTVVRCFGFQFNVDYRVTMLLVFWALGWSMIALSALVHLPLPVVTAFGVALIAGHNLFDGVRSTNPIWIVMHGPGLVINRPSHVLFASYPLIPWVGVTAAGFGLGRIYEWAPDRRRAFLLRAGVLMSVAFVVLRALNVYGDPSRWRVQHSSVATMLSFLNTTKYPPSLLFLLMTLGPALILLAAFERGVPRLFVPLRTFGRVPLFYFIGHLVAIHLAAVAVCAVRYGAVHWMFESPDLAHFPITEPPGWPLRLPGVYAIWAGIVALMYLPCRWYAAVKARSARGWLSYF
jgi:uncharacterized membrane protein